MFSNAAWWAILTIFDNFYCFYEFRVKVYKSIMIKSHYHNPSKSYIVHNYEGVTMELIILSDSLKLLIILFLQIMRKQTKSVYFI